MGERTEAARRLDDAEQQPRVAIERRDTLQETAGAPIAELEQRLRQMAASKAANMSTQRRTEDRVGVAREAKGAAGGKAGGLRRQLDETTAERPAPSRGCGGSPGPG